MIKLKIYQIDAFTNKLFGGNPAAVVPLENWINEKMMQQIAAENNLSETAFFVKNNDIFEIRWFTPTVEIELCGHATLASAYVIFNFLKYTNDIITFNCKVGELVVRKEKNNFITLNFPSDIGQPTSINEVFNKIFNNDWIEVQEARTKYLVELDSEEMVQNFIPDFDLIKQLPKQLIITAKGNDVDFVSRFFAPNFGVNEDPVTGSAHCVLVPYWANKLQKNELNAIQLSNRKGYLACKFLNDRIEMSGEAVCYLTGQIQID